MKTSAKKAFSAYSTYSKTGQLPESKVLEMEEDCPLTGEKKTPPPPPPQKKAITSSPPQPKGTQPSAETKTVKKTKTEEKPKPKVKTKEERDKELEETVKKIAEYTAKVQQAIFNAIKTVFVFIFSMLLKLGTLIVTPFIFILKWIFKILYMPIKLVLMIIGTSSHVEQKTSSSGEATTEDSVEEGGEEEVQVPPERPEKKATFNDMLELNIIFMDNYKRPLYKKLQTRGTGRLGVMEENLILDTAINAIKECAEFTTELSSPTGGFFAGKKTFEVMSNVVGEDVQMFLGFVKSYPGKYIGKIWKISETFATWIINNSPTE